MQTLTEEIHKDLCFFGSFIAEGCAIYKPLLMEHASIR